MVHGPLTLYDTNICSVQLSVLLSLENQIYGIRVGSGRHRFSLGEPGPVTFFQPNVPLEACCKDKMEVGMMLLTALAHL